MSLVTLHFKRRKDSKDECINSQILEWEVSYWCLVRLESHTESSILLKLSPTEQFIEPAESEHQDKGCWVLITHDSEIRSWLVTSDFQMLWSPQRVPPADAEEDESV